MTESTLNVICGPVEDYILPNASLGKIIFDSLVKRNPEDVLNINAITGDVLTCDQLLRRSVKLATVFEELGLTKGDVITMLNKNSVDYVVPILAAFYMGIIVNPLNPDLKEQLRYGLLTSKPKLILCSDATVEAVLEVKSELDFSTQVLLMGPRSGKHLTVESLDEMAQSVPGGGNTFRPENFDPIEQRALILHSSGTTGLSKGVLLTHRNLRDVIGSFAHPDYGNVTNKDTTIAVIPFFHMFGFTVQLLMMAISLKTVVMDEWNPEVFLKSIQNYKATKLFCVPPLLLFLSKDRLVDDYNLDSLKDIIVGGASVSKELQHDIVKKLSGVTVRQAFGLTETSGACTFQTIGSNKPGSVGTLIPLTKAKICNPETKQNVSPYKLGEICLKGPTLMQGYFGNQSATEACIDEEGFFHSGDLGYYDTDGFLYVMGRISELISFNGCQIAPVELEAVILTHPAVKECGVVGVPEEGVGEVPCALVVLERRVGASHQEIMDFVAERISSRKHLRGGVKFVNNIPKTPSGKIIRRQLMEMWKN